MGGWGGGVEGISGLRFVLFLGVFCVPNTSKRVLEKAAWGIFIQKCSEQRL